MTSFTPFTGLERLAPGEQLRSDGFKFQDIDRGLIDRALRIGCVTHRHDGHPALADPTAAPTVTTPSSGGTIGAGVAIYVGYTLNDEDNGETLISTPVLVTTPGGYSAPSPAPTASVGYTAGTLMSGNYAYAATVTDGAGGETVVSPAVLVSVATGHANAGVTISGLAALLANSSHSAPAASWRLWRSQGGGPWYLIGSGTGDSLVDTGIAGDCSVSPPNRATTRGTNSLSVMVPSAGQPSGAVSFNIYASPDATFTNPCRLAGPLPTSAFDHAQVFTALTLLDGSPPKVSTCFPGANPITGAAPSGGGTLGVAKTTGPSQAIAANTTTTVAIPAPTGMPEQYANRIVVALIVTHPDVSQLKAVLRDTSGDSATLFDAGTFIGTQIGSPNFNSGDPDAYVYFSDVVRGQVDFASGEETYHAQLSAGAGVAPSEGQVYVPVTRLAMLGGDAIAELSLDFIESGGSAGMLHAVTVYYVDASFDALAIVPPPLAEMYDATSAPDVDYTLNSWDAGQVLRATGAVGRTITIPPDTFPVGAVLWVGQDGAGQVTFAAGAGVTLKARALHTSARYGMVRLWQQAANVWWLTGDLA